MFSCYIFHHNVLKRFELEIIVKNVIDIKYRLMHKYSSTPMNMFEKLSIQGKINFIEYKNTLRSV